MAVALGLAAIFAERLARDTQGFWFPNREAMEGASLGFSDALMMLSPFGAVLESLSRGQLSRLDEVAKEVRTNLSQAKFGAGRVARLNALDYQRLFDPGFLQFVAVDPEKARTAWESAPDKVIRELRGALDRVSPTKLPRRR